MSDHGTDDAFEAFTTSSLSGTPSTPPNDLTGKYRQLKRQFLELEEKHKDEQQAPTLGGNEHADARGTQAGCYSRRHTLINPDPSALLDRITELERQPGFISPSTSNGTSGLPTPARSLDGETSQADADDYMHLRSRSTRNGVEKDVDAGSASDSQPGEDEDASIDPDWHEEDEDNSAYYLGSPRGVKRAREGIFDAPEAKRRSPRTPEGSKDALPPDPLSTPPVTPPAARPYNPYTFLTPAGGTPPSFSYIAPYPYWPMQYVPPPSSPPTLSPQSQTPPPPPQVSPTSPNATRSSKPKRLKPLSVTTKSYSVPNIPRDKNRKLMLPLNVGIMTLIRLGDVCMREHFHTERYIFPVGYEVTRRYMSTVDPNTEVVYHCTILDGGDGPKFQVTPSDVPDRPVVAGTATGAWSSIVKQANAIRHRRHSNSVSGPDFFGLNQNTIKHLIQELPNADRLRDYVGQHFLEGGPLGGRHAAVLPATPGDATPSTTPVYSPPPPPEQRSPSSHYPAHTLEQSSPGLSRTTRTNHYLPHALRVAARSSSPSLLT
ncbi:hypothetical protein MKEN_00358700 [Mycena kentingensis (nom. inval.)]|nr:hypothetical protein MKEN_00358700 [Mycena kentingensis (nom. inval.)]